MLHLASIPRSVCSLLVGMAMIVTTGCSSSDDDIPTAPEGPNAPTQTLTYDSIEQGAVDMSTLGKDAYAALEDRAERVIRDKETFTDFWTHLHADQTPPPPLPEVDFSSEMVLAVVLGERPTGGYRVEIESITFNQNPDVIRAFVTETQPGTDCVVSQATTAPYHVVKMSALSVETIVFADHGTTVQSCN